MGRFEILSLVLVAFLTWQSTAMEIKVDGCFGAVPAEPGQRTVIIVGGGLAGMAAAVEVCFTG